MLGDIGVFDVAHLFLHGLVTTCNDQALRVPEHSYMPAVIMRSSLLKQQFILVTLS